MSIMHIFKPFFLVAIEKSNGYYKISPWQILGNILDMLMLIFCGMLTASVSMIINLVREFKGQLKLRTKENNSRKLVIECSEVCLVNTVHVPYMKSQGSWFWIKRVDSLWTPPLQSYNGCHPILLHDGFQSFHFLFLLI